MNGPKVKSIMSSRNKTFGSVVSQVVSRYGLLLLTGILIIVYSIILPSTFPTVFTFNAIFNVKSVDALAALAVMIPMAAKHFDLSVGYVLGMAQVLGMGLQVELGLPPSITIVLVLLMGLLIGLINGLLVTRAQIDSFIATLGTGTALYGLNLWFTGGREITGNLPNSFTGMAADPFGIPLPAVYVMIIGMALWVIFERLPLGRYLYFLGASPRAAELIGISARKNVTLAFMGSGLLASAGGILLVSQLQVGESAVGPEYLLPSFTAALLGATTIRPGRINVWGTVVSVLLLSVAIAGLQQMGAQFFVQPLFDGVMLVVAVGFSGFVLRRRKERTINAEVEFDKSQREAKKNDGPAATSRSSETNPGGGKG